MNKIVVCGLSNRALGMFIESILQQFSETNQIVGVLDKDPRRIEICKDTFAPLRTVPSYQPHEFQKMIEETKPDTVIVTSRDDTHIDYILQGLKNNLTVITEKPMVTNSEDALKVMEAEKHSMGKVIVAFNYRYNPYHRKIKELILEGKIGRVTSVDLNWYIDTYHGASYFKRWNRKREFSGGLSIHKSTHHFDLVNWWIDQQPIEVFAYGGLNYFGKDGEYNPSSTDNRYCSTCDEKVECSYYMRWSNRRDNLKIKDDHIRADSVEKSAANYSQYRPDACIFDHEINIEDTYVATVKFDKGAFLSYSVNFSLPYEGYRLAINGTKGRIETTEFHEPSRIPFPIPEQTIEFYPLFNGAKETIHVLKTGGGHGGGDPVLLEDLFLGVDKKRPYPILAGAEQGAYSIAVGEGVWRSVKENKPIKIEELLKLNGEKVLRNT
ncbi:MAG TPA: Gfo/Idh/MocA family oxidoreductase [Niallia sp.]|nr:Gfo/Idh/MocA family oxidoreductase [Niallia sp.]